MSTVISHQTAHLAPGPHRGPEDGVDVLELASLLAHERFGRRPRSVCPVIATFLQALGDDVFAADVDDARLRALAAAIVGTRGGWRARRMRRRRCRERRMTLGDPPAGALQRACLVLLGDDAAAVCAAAFAADGRAADGLAFAEELAALGDRTTAADAGRTTAVRPRR
jgi:hypothetical protein